ncbi:substrate-binding domain-containing protein [Streptomyces vilmorinianum]|uniref:substrate-binding domain-containing protein n=1 Tax=Streptomyces vilmorinianum TaxID=3051092 RepID=UPI0010FBAD73|nr:substrate-binding domain-containing protein [Streptomyces vilmorinianum]
MDWLTAENVIAVVTALLGVLVSAGVVWYERRVPRHRQIGYRVQLNTPLGRQSQGRTGDNVRIGLFNDLPDIADGASLVLLRVENDGGLSIGREDYNAPEHATHGLTVTYGDGQVRGVVATTSPEYQDLLDHLTEAAGLRKDGSSVLVPKVPLNQGQHFKLLVLLAGSVTDEAVTVTGGLKEGVVRRNHSTTPDDTPPRFSPVARNITIVLTACVIALATIIVRSETPPPIGCAKGSLTVTGSTAFAPVVRELAKKYEKDCEGATVVVDAHGSTAGIRELAAAGAAGGGQGSPAVVALSDGRKPGGYPQLRESMVAVSLFTLVLNDGIPVTNLSLDEVRRLYQGEITNWKQIPGGPDRPVLLVSRDANSGTREVFQRRVLGRNEPANSSRDCESKDDPAARVVRCELDSTEQVLSTVARLPGAIGYTELRAGSGLKGLHRVAIDGRAPNVDEIGESTYPYREIEYAYTWGQPPADSLTSSFLTYLSRGSGQDVIRTHGHLPCATPKGLRICGEG